VTPAENERFTQFLRDAAKESRRIGYPPNDFIKMLNADGGFETAKRLFSKAQHSSGFFELYNLGHTELTVEALVLEHEWKKYFDQELLDLAAKKLKEVGYELQNRDEALASASSGTSRPPIASETLESALELSDTSLSSGISRILAEYLEAAAESFTGHPLANFIRRDLRDAVKSEAGRDGDGLIFKGSAGQGNWARGPWLGIFNPVVTNGAQQGYYPCYLFKEDMSGVYLSLNQGMTEAKEHYKADAKTALRARAENYRAMLGNQTAHFSELTINLAPASPTNDTAFYEAGNICAAYYPMGAVPDEAKLVADLKAMLGLYEILIQGETDTDVSLDNEDDKPVNLEYEDATRFRMHKRIERNAALVKKVKQKKGCNCEICGANFETRYGAIGTGYIEAHHLKPLASLKGTKVAMDPEHDFAVLCANCHRMVHRSGLVDDIAGFKREHFHG
jgi:5-methylcytosine-specific restriction enzyme A